MLLAAACYFHPVGSGQRIWGCDLGTFPDPPTWLIAAFSLIAVLSIALGVVTVFLGRNPLPFGSNPRRTPLAIRLEGVSEILAAVMVLAASAALAQARGHHDADPRWTLIELVGFPLLAGLWALAWYFDRRSPRHPSTA
jgi:hypothetical protein